MAMLETAVNMGTHTFLMDMGNGSMEFVESYELVFRQGYHKTKFLGNCNLKQDFYKRIDVTTDYGNVYTLNGVTLTVIGNMVKLSAKNIETHIDLDEIEID